MSETVDLYGEDFLLWTQEQAKLLRNAAQHGVNLPFDWENVAEEIESLGRSDRRELRSRIASIIEHLLKLEHSSVTEPREGWLDTVERSRQEAENLLKEPNPKTRGVGNRRQCVRGLRTDRGRRPDPPRGDRQRAPS